jgi:CubicO group peptidase (beta-lactamase class C family)
MKLTPALVAVVLMTTFGSPVQPAPKGLAAAGTAALTTRLDAAARSGQIPAVVALVTSSDAVLYEHAAGKLSARSRDALPPNAIFRIASMTKPITSAAVMALVEAGRVRLDDPASVYVPAVDALKVAVNVKADGSYDTRAPARAITVRDLLTHTSGIGYSFSDPLLFALQKAGKSDADFPLLHDPGEKWTYGAGTKYLGEVVQQASGQPLEAYLATQFFGPLGMSDTGFDVPASARARVVTVRQRERGTLTEIPNPETLRVAPRGDGGLYSTAQDYARLLRMFLNGGRAGSARVLTEYSIREMTRNQIGRLTVREQPAADAARTRPFPLGAGRDTWGLGFQIAAPPTAPNRRGAGSYGWAGIDNTYFWIDPTRQLGVIVLMQQLPFYDEASIRLVTDVEEIVNRSLN